MKYAVSTYSLGHYASELGLEGTIDKVAEMGFDGIEYAGFSSDLELAKRIGDYARSKGLEVVNLAVGTDFLTDLDKGIADMQKMVDVAAALGCPVMRHDVSNGYPDKPKTDEVYDEVIPVLAAGCRAVTEYAAERGIRTMTENHGFFSQDAKRVRKLIEAVANPNFGALIDVGNFLCADEYPPESVETLKDFAFHVHAKDFHVRPADSANPGRGFFRSRGGNYLRGAVIGHGTAEVATSLAILKKNGYDGYLSIEFEGMEDNLLGVEIGLENIRRFWEEA